MTDRELAVEIARQILKGSRDLGWLMPLAREFLRLIERRQAPEPKDE
jgi:hypothetical protein